MSQSDASLEYSGYTFPFDSPADAGLTEHYNLFKTPAAQALEQSGVVVVNNTLLPSDYAKLAEEFRACIDHCPAILEKTSHVVDKRFGNDAGFVRKERKLDPATGKQIQDPKNVFHFNEQARARWQGEFRIAPAELKSFLETGYAIHNAMLNMARTAIIEQLEPTHQDITQAILPKNSPSVSFMRHVDYDDYEVDPTQADIPVALRHLDISWLTLQGNASAPGFYGISPDGTKTYYDDHNGKAYGFMGVAHRKIYGRESFIKPLPHGVDRIVPTGSTQVERRQADILFLNTWKIDCSITGEDTKTV